MRNAPVPVRFCNDLKKAMAVSDAHVRCTHSSDYVIEINRLFTQMAVVGINCCGSREDTIKSMLDAVKYFVTTQEDLKRLQQHVEWLRSLSLARLDSLRLEVDIKMQLHCFEHPGLILHSSGHAGDSFFCAIWALLSGRDFEETILNAVNLGNDADTVGAITGQLAGAVYGASAIPGDWKKNLYCEKVITAFAKALYGDSISGPISINVGSKDCNRLALSLKQKNQ
jgi:ADP-ribosylglycohydrolase